MAILREWLTSSPPLDHSWWVCWRPWTGTLSFLSLWFFFIFHIVSNWQTMSAATCTFNKLKLKSFSKLRIFLDKKFLYSQGSSIWINCFLTLKFAKNQAEWSWKRLLSRAILFISNLSDVHSRVLFIMAYKANLQLWKKLVYFTLCHAINPLKCQKCFLVGKAPKMVFCILKGNVACKSEDHW